MSPEHVYYLEEGCPFLALALHDRYGYQLAVLYDDGALDDWGRGEEETPAHVFVLAGDQALDVKGRRSLQELKEDFFDLQEPVVREVSRAELLDLCGDERPFYTARESDLEKAAAVVDELGLL